MDYRKYNIDNFLSDDSFITYVIDPKSPAGKIWAKRLKEIPGLNAEAKRAQNIIKSVKFMNTTFSENEKVQLWEKINEKTTLEAPRNRFIKIPAWLKVAAAVVLVLVSSVLIIQKIKSPDIASEFANIEIVKECPRGSKMQVSLPDGSMVILNSGSRISYNSEFNNNIRAVKLEGEGFFDVTRNPQKPFIISSGDIRTSVLGTTFNVKSYSEENQVEVVVESGLVSVSKYEENKSGNNQPDYINEVFLNPGNQVVYNKANDQFSEIKTVKVDDFIAWKSGIIVFNSSEFNEIVTRLERWYGVEFEIEKDLVVPDGFTGKFDNVSLTRVLNAISYTSKIEFELTGNKVFIKSKIDK